MKRDTKDMVLFRALCTGISHEAEFEHKAFEGAGRWDILEQLQGNQDRRFQGAEQGLGLKGWGSMGQAAERAPVGLWVLDLGENKTTVVFWGLKQLQLTSFFFLESNLWWEGTGVHWNPVERLSY